MTRRKYTPEGNEIHGVDVEWRCPCCHNGYDWRPGFVDEPKWWAVDDLLDACLEVQRVLKDPRTTTSMPNTLAKVKAAIAKATGK